MDPRAASLDASVAAAAAAAEGAYVTPELLVRAVRDISARRRTSSAADITMYLQRRFPMRHADRRLLKEVERKLHIATQHGLFVHTGYSYRLPAERLGKALSSRDLSAFWTHYHRLERDCGSESSTESEARSDGEERRGEGSRAQEGPSGNPPPTPAPTPTPPPQLPPPPPPAAGQRRRPRKRAARRCRCGRCRVRGRGRGRARGLSASLVSRAARGRGRRRVVGGAPRRRNPRRHGRPAVARKWLRTRRQRQWRPTHSRAGPLAKCVPTTLHQQPLEAAGPSNSLLMYLVLQLPPESDDATESS